MYDSSNLELDESLLGVFKTHISSGVVIDLQNNKLVQKFLRFFYICFQCEIAHYYFEEIRKKTIKIAVEKTQDTKFSIMVYLRARVPIYHRA
jgi:hypothetical protein